MRCPYCNENDSNVVETEGGTKKDSISRIRRCNECERRYKTIEVIESDFSKIEEKARRYDYLRSMSKTDFDSLGKELLKFEQLVDWIRKEK